MPVESTVTQFALKESAAFSVPFFAPQISEAEIAAVSATLRSGWLTTGPEVKAFEKEFAASVSAKFAIALNSCTAALHLAVEALGLKENQAVLVPTMTFAASAEIILYRNAIPILVDCDPVTGNIDLCDAEEKIAKLREGKLPVPNGPQIEVVGIIPVHVGGYMLNIAEIKQFAEKHGLWIVEDAAHAFPAAWRSSSDVEWQYCGDGTADVTCYSFYANKTITTGEGGMAVTNDQELADKIRLLSLHGLSNDAWNRYAGSGSWDYRIVLPGYKYNLTDIAGAIGRGQLSRAEEMRFERESVATRYLRSFADVAEFELPPTSDDRIHSWHLFPIRLNLDLLSIDRNEFIEKLKVSGVGCSVHWRPLHLHPLYSEVHGWNANHLPVATKLWERLVSLPIYSSMNDRQLEYVVQTVKQICFENTTRKNVSCSVKGANDSHMGLPRTLEVALAAIGLVIASPILLIAAAAIKFNSSGPVLFRQSRVGRNGKQFILLKFRTMFVVETGTLVTSANDERITKVGRFLRKTKIDELPELWNIVRGEMCIVGPRPEVPELVDLSDPQWDEILQTNPGLTDPVTLRLRNEEELLANAGGEADYYENVIQPYKLRGYVRFLRTRDWKTDVSIIYQTMKAIVSPRSVGVPSDDELRYS